MSDDIKTIHELLDTNGVGLAGEPLMARVSDVVAEWKRLKEAFGYTYCAYCNARFEADKHDLSTLIGAHITECQNHPFTAIANKAQELEAKLNKVRGVDPMKPLTARLWLCWFKHQYEVTDYDDKNHILGHLHPWAGCRVECKRCGKLYWDDRREETKAVSR
jgi:hypothetical protein